MVRKFYIRSENPISGRKYAENAAINARWLATNSQTTLLTSLEIIHQAKYVPFSLPFAQ
jgi:hypothetical protein